MLDGVLGHQAGVVAAPAGHDEHLVDGPELLVGDVDLVEDQGAVGQQPVEQGVGHRFGLLVHLLAHEVVVAVLAGGVEVPVDGQLVRGSTSLPSRAVTRTEPGRSSATWSSSSTKKSRVRPRMAGMSEARKAASVADPHQQGRDPAGGHDQVGLVGVDHGQRERPPDPAERRPHRAGQAGVGSGGQRGLDQVGQHLGVGLRLRSGGRRPPARRSAPRGSR